MKSFQYISDIHIEFFNDFELHNFIQKIKVNSDICVLAGDIGNPFLLNYCTFLENISKLFKKIFIIAGNHEYYYNDLQETKKQIKKVIEILPNISFLDNTYEDYNEIRWIGTTQWTKITNPNYTINDINTIKDMNITKYNELYLICEQFLTSILEQSCKDNKKCVVITHHLPIFDLTDKQFRDSFNKNYNQWYSGCLDDLVKKYNNIIKAWVYGHTHIQSIQFLYNVNFLCNPIGYIGENDNNNEINNIWILNDL